MSTQRTYTVGNKGTVWRMTDHDDSTWTDVSLSSMVGQTNVLLSSTGEGSQNITEGWLNYINLVDVMSDPADSDKVCTIAGRAQEARTNSVGSGYSGIFMSHDGGNSWFFPGGDWVNVCNTGAALCRNHFEVFYTDSVTIYIISQFGYLFKSTDGGLSFNTVKKSGIPVNATGFEWVSCIHMRKDPNGGLDYGVVAAIEDVTQVASGTRVYKTINGGASWSPLNGSLPLDNDYLLSQEVGEPGGIYISEDQNTIIVQAEDVTTKSTDGGATFTCTLNNYRRCFHLTWYDTYKDISDDFWVTGQINEAINNSTDVANTWTQTLAQPGYVIYGAHFYTQNTGYFLNSRSVLQSTQSGSNPTVSLSLPSEIVDASGKVIAETLLYAIWSSAAPAFYELTDCLGQHGTIVVQGDQIQMLFDAWGPGNSNIITISNNVDIDSTVCWSLDLYSGPIPPSNLILVNSTDTITIYDNCDQCLPDPPVSECWRLLACENSTGSTCETICTHTGFDFTPYQNQWIWINGDTTCAYSPVRIRETVYCTPDTISSLCGLAAPWSVQYEITTFIYNGVSYIPPGIQPSVIMTDLTLDPLECTGLTCASVACSTTENSYGNLPDFLNSYFTSLGFECPLVAFPNDPANNPSISGTSYRIQYAEGDTFILVIEKTGSTGTGSYQYLNNQGKITFSIDGVGQPDCAEDVYTLCSGQTSVPLIDVDNYQIVETNCIKLPCTIDATATFTNVTTNGGSDGTITLTVIGAQNPTFILWAGPNGFTTNTQNLTGLEPGIYTVIITDTGIPDCSVTLQIIITEPPAPPEPPETCEIIPRLGEPGFSVRNCDPKTVIKIKSQFSDSIYALFKRMRYGVETCCEFDLDKIDIKHQLLELGEMNDPDACKIICNSYTISSINPEDIINVEYRDCFGAKITVTLDSITPSLTFCSQINTIVSLGAAITITLIEECCDPVQIISMKYYCVSLVTTDITGIIQWYDYEGILKTKTLTNVIGSCGPEGVDKMYMCAQEGTVAPIAPLLITDLDITEMGAC